MAFESGVILVLANIGSEPYRFFPMTAISDPDTTTAAAPKTGVRRLVPLVLIAAGVIAAVAFGLHWLLVGRFLETTNDAYLKADAMVVAPRVGGYVSEVLVAANQDVAPGQLLVRIEDDTYKAEVAHAQADVDAAQADIWRLQAEIVHQQSILEQARAAASVAAAKAAYAGREADRYGKLSETGAVSHQQVDQSRTMSGQTSAELAEAQAAVTSADRAVDVLKAEVGQAESRREAASAALQSARLDLAATELRSRIKGRIGDKTVSIGQYVVAGMRLMSVMPLQDVYLEANYKETQIGRLKVGQPVEIHVDALPGAVVPGRVESLSPGTGAEFALLPPENATGNFTKIIQRVPVRIRIEGDPAVRAALLPGLSVTATVDTRGNADGGR
jgi:membrane fusion protein (multidrug efflux system)